MERIGFPATEGLQGLPLSPREQEVLDTLRGGMMRKEAADYLVISEDTMKSHIKSAFGKLGVRNTAGAFARLDERKARALCRELEELALESLAGDLDVPFLVVRKLLSFIDRAEVSSVVHNLLGD